MQCRAAGRGRGVLGHQFAANSVGSFAVRFVVWWCSFFHLVTVEGQVRGTHSERWRRPAGESRVWLKNSFLLEVGRVLCSV